MIEFRKVIQSGVESLNPFEGFKPNRGGVEIRWDPLTGVKSRIVHFPVRKIRDYDFDGMVDRSLRHKCPFCGENIPAMTSKFNKDVFGFERFEQDGVTVIPNILSFDKYCLVAIISPEHFADMDMLMDNRYLSKGIRAVLEVLRIIAGFDRDVNYFSINCNYMPMSGSSILHPHIQAIAGEHPTNYHGLLLDKSEAFFLREGLCFWDELIREEKRRGERFIGDDGRTFWYAPFAPRGNIDVSCIMGKNSIFELDDNDLASLDENLVRVLSYLKNEGVRGFNFAIYSGISGQSHFRTNMKIVARRFLPPLNAADTNYFDKLHMESACVFFPEDVAREARAVWGEASGK